MGPPITLALFGSPGGGELLLILLALLLLFGAKNLPKMARTLGRTLEEFRRAAREVSNEFMRADEDIPAPRPKVLKQSVSRSSEPPPPADPPSDATEPISASVPPEPVAGEEDHEKA